MQISKLLPAIGIGVICLSLVSVRADDTPAEAAARAALMEKMADLDASDTPATSQAQPAPAVAPAQSPDTATPPPVMVSAPTGLPETNESPVVTETPEQAPSAPPMVATSTSEFPAVPPPDGPTVNSDAAQAQMNASQPNAQSPVVIIHMPDSSTIPTPTPSMAPSPAPTSSPMATPAPAPANSYDAAAQAALNTSQANAMVVSTPAVVQTAPPASSTPSVPNVNDVTAKELGLAPIQAPPPPVSANQQQELQALLQQYEADQITPDVYQTERAKIIAGQ